jgi:FkbM family methyltransferase
MNKDEIYVFGNGLRVYRRDLITEQEKRYNTPGNPNLHEPVEEKLILQTFESKMPSSPVFLDVGAGIGYYSMLIKSRWPTARVIAVEALPRHALCIKSNFRLNHFPVDAVEVRQVAVTENDGWADLVDEGYSSYLCNRAEFPANSLPVRVPALTLTHLIDQIGHVHLMKMDIQGMELPVLAAAKPLLSSGQIRYALIGTHGGAIHSGVRNLLKEECRLEIIYDDPDPEMQPDGILLAAAKL